MPAERKRGLNGNQPDAWARRLSLALAALACLAACPAYAAAAEISLPERLQELQKAYPDHVVKITATHVLMSNGHEILIDDGKPKTHDQKLADADIEDMLSQVYPVDGCAPPGGVPAPDFDPGRIRNESFFKAIYGETKNQVTQRLGSVDWYGQKLPVSTTLSVNEKLAGVEKELMPSLQALKAYLTPSAGTFAWRPIAGTTQLSTHSYGIAIDISTAKTEYWRWSKSAAGTLAPRQPKVPSEIVAAFESRGFIWGGHWYHFDTMHFEYRPELIAIGKLAKAKGCAQ